MAIVIAAGAYLVWYLRDLILLVVTAVVLASSIEPGILLFMRYKLSRVVSVLFMYLLVFGSLFGLIYFFAPPILEDTQNVLATLPQYLQSLDITDPITATPGAIQTVESTQSLLQTILDFRTAFASTGESALRIISSFFGGLASLFLVVVLSFYFAVVGTGVEDFIRLVTPKKHEDYLVDLWLRAHGKIGQWMQGQILISLLSGVIIYLGLLILGVPYALLLAVITAFCELIPIFGSFIAAIFAMVVAFTTGGITLALIVLGLFVVMNLFQANLIYPLVVKKIVGIPPLLVILSLVVGGSLAGFLGVLLAVPTIAAIREFLNDFDKRKRSRAMQA